LIFRYEHIKKKIKQVIEWPIIKNKTYEKLGVEPSSGILLYGPSGKYQINLLNYIIKLPNILLFTLANIAK
jgi:SpoVK/Ycf46/Vps4 family AAA+-type ATPase